MGSWRELEVWHQKGGLSPTCRSCQQWPLDKSPPRHLNFPSARQVYNGCLPPWTGVKLDMKGEEKVFVSGSPLGRKPPPSSCRPGSEAESTA